MSICYAIENTKEESKESWLVAYAIGPFRRNEWPLWEHIPNDCLPIVYYPDIIMRDPFGSAALICPSKYAYDGFRLSSVIKVYVATRVDIFLKMREPIDYITKFVHIAELLKKHRKQRADVIKRPKVSL